MFMDGEWNGATEVQTWRVFGGSGSDELAQLTAALRSGFETVICLRGSPRYVAVQAVDAGGNVLGVSKTTTV